MTKEDTRPSLSTPPMPDSTNYLEHEALLAEVLKRNFVDFPTGWAIQAAGLTHTSPHCSAVLTLALLCDCGAIDARWTELRTEAVLDRRTKLLAHPAWQQAQAPGMCERCGEAFDKGAAICQEDGVGSRAECCSWV